MTTDWISMTNVCGGKLIIINKRRGQLEPQNSIERWIVGGGREREDVLNETEKLN